jgi:hypothetical protein
MVFIERKFIPYPQSDQHSHGHSYRKSEDVDERIDFVLAHIAQSGYQVVFQHSYCSIIPFSNFFASCHLRQGFGGRSEAHSERRLASPAATFAKASVGGAKLILSEGW